MTAKFKGGMMAGFVGAATYLAVELLFRWSRLRHESARDLLENLAWMTFQASIFVVVYLAVTSLIFRRFGYQANSSKSER
jgi:hypothetical protein